jgi:Polysaccharide biosynthesis C-terminal domain
VGAAIGTGAAFCLYVPAHLEICRRRLGFSLRPLGRTLARSLVAAGAMAAVLLAFGTEELSPAEWVGGALGGTAVFGLVLLGLREVSVTEVRGLAGAAKAGVLRT